MCNRLAVSLNSLRKGATSVLDRCSLPGSYSHSGYDLSAEESTTAWTPSQCVIIPSSLRSGVTER